MSDYKLRIDAHALFQLGEQLISDDEQALLELIKNSYDADSPLVRVRVQADYIPVLGRDPVPADALGLIEIEDEGAGMADEMIKKSWLMVSLSFKRDVKRQGQPVGKFQRHPLGDKGLGRLGTMRLGKCLSVETRHSPTEPGKRVTFQWSDCRSGRPLDEVPIHAESVLPNGKTGSTVRIYGLNDLGGWKAPSRAARLATKLTGLISPFESFRDFKIDCTINDTPIDLGRVSKKLRETANVHIDYNWNGQHLTVSVRIKLIWFKKKTLGYDEFIGSDEGQRLFEYLRQQKKFSTFGVKRSEQGGWFLELHTTRARSDLHLDKDPDLADPGPFHGLMDYYDLDRGSDLPRDFLGEGMDYREVVKELAQVYIYRDNFGIRMPNDWMELGKAWTSGAGYYSLRPGTTIGYFQISVAGNAQLIEKSDREGFIENPAHRGFMQFVKEIKGFLNPALNWLGKASVAYLNEKTQVHADDESNSAATFDRTVQDLEKLLKAGTLLKAKLEETQAKRTLEFRRVDAAARTLYLDRTVKASVRENAQQLMSTLAALEKQLGVEKQEIDKMLAELAEKRTLAAIIRRRVDEFSERGESFAEMVATGLSAQAAAHDVPALLQQIDGAAMLLLKEGRKGIVDGPVAVRNAETILGANTGVKQMLDLVQPMLRGRRWAKRTAKVSELVDEYFQLRGARLKSRGILWEVSVDVTTDFMVTINPGRLTQVLDNLVTNSEYWIEDHFGKGSKAGRLRVDIQKPRIIFSDNGPGIRPDLEGSMFELFVSGKPAGQGNGMGLFITRQLLERDNCTITLDPERNRNDRLFKFVINLADIRSDKS
jgi:signal transduction histidine kinase